MSFLEDFIGWISSNLSRIIFSAVAIVIVFLVYKLLTKTDNEVEGTAKT